MSEATKRLEAFSRQVIKAIWNNVDFHVSMETDISGIDGHIEGKTLQHKYDATIPRFYRLWDEHFAKEKGHPERDWHETHRRAEVYIFTTGGSPSTMDTSGAWAVRTTLATLNDLESTMDLHDNTNLTSRGYFLKIGTIYDKEIGRVGQRRLFADTTLVAHSNPLISLHICAHDTPPVPKWANCLPCEFFKDGHCTTPDGIKARTIIEARDKETA
jgi:hypothetical protein